MSNVLYVNRVSRADLEDLEALFTTVGDVKNCHVETLLNSDRDTQFGVFEMATEQHAFDCIERFNGYRYEVDRYLSVAADRPCASPKKDSANVRGKM